MRGTSGRVVVEIDPALKRRLHSKLAADGTNLKEWFLRQVDAYLSHDNAVQLLLKPLSGSSNRAKDRR